MRAEKAGKGQRAARSFPAPPLTQHQKWPCCRLFCDGETQTRTGDTTIFSRVLYQLSYLAVAARC